MGRRALKQEDKKRMEERRGGGRHKVWQDSTSFERDAGAAHVTHDVTHRPTYGGRRGSLSLLPTLLCTATNYYSSRGEEGRPKVFATYCHVIDQRGERQFRLFSCVSFMGLGLPYLLYITLLHFSFFVCVCAAPIIDRGICTLLFRAGRYRQLRKRKWREKKKRGNSFIF